jgi:phage terminase large subunit-like protein
LCLHAIRGCPSGLREIVAAAKQYRVHEIGFDPYNATDLCKRLAEKHGLMMVEFRQGYLSMSAPSKTFEKLVLSGRLRHGENPILRWMASHVSVATDPAGNIKPVKPDRNRGTKRIDGIVAAIMGVGRESLRERSGSVYERREMLVLDWKREW